MNGNHSPSLQPIDTALIQERLIDFSHDLEFARSNIDLIASDHTNDDGPARSVGLDAEYARRLEDEETLDGQELLFSPLSDHVALIVGMLPEPSVLFAADILTNEMLRELRRELLAFGEQIEVRRQFPLVVSESFAPWLDSMERKLRALIDHLPPPNEAATPAPPVIVTIFKAALRGAMKISRRELTDRIKKGEILLAEAPASKPDSKLPSKYDREIKVDLTQFSPDVQARIRELLQLDISSKITGSVGDARDVAAQPALKAQ